MYKYKIFIMLLFYVSNAISSPLILGVGAGYEELNGLVSDQVHNVLTRMSLSTEIPILTNAKPSNRSNTKLGGSRKLSQLHVGFEVAARNGFTGALEISNEIQTEISGPTPVALSSPMLEFLGTVRTCTDSKIPYILGKFGFDFSVLKFDRADLMSTNIANILGFVGFGFKVTETSDVHILVTGSKPLTRINLGDIYTIDNPYTQKAILVEFVRAF